VTVREYVFPDVFDLGSARGIAEELSRYVRDTPSPVVNAVGLRQAGVPLLQILVAGQRQAERDGKLFAVKTVPGSALLASLSACGLDPAHCGVSVDPDHTAPLSDLQTGIRAVSASEAGASIPSNQRT
jgi:hypothetical protein